jgi:hypothetical protein
LSAGERTVPPRMVTKQRCWLPTAVLCAALAGGCVLPLGPEFEAEENLAPQEISTNPPVGQKVTDSKQTYTVTVEDPNRFDDLYVLKLIDYPPFVQELSRRRDPDQRPHRGLDQPNIHVITHQPDCHFDQISATIPDHQLMILVSDRPFLPPQFGPTPQDTVWDRTEPGGHVLRFIWPFRKDDCQ